MNIKTLQGPYKHVYMSEDEVMIELNLYEADPTLKTVSVRREFTVTAVYPTPFCQEHMAYIRRNPKVNPRDYLANLRASIKIR